MFDEGASLFDVIAHENGEEPVGFGGVFEFDAQQRAGIRVHGGGPQFVGIHLAEALEAFDVDAFAAQFPDAFDDGCLYCGCLVYGRCSANGWLL